MRGRLDNNIILLCGIVVHSCLRACVLIDAKKPLAAAVTVDTKNVKKAAFDDGVPSVKND